MMKRRRPTPDAHTSNADTGFDVRGPWVNAWDPNWERVSPTALGDQPSGEDVCARSPDPQEAAQGEDRGQAA